MKNRFFYLFIALLAFAIGFAAYSAREKKRVSSQSQALSALSAKSQNRVVEGHREREILTLSKGMEETGGLEEWLRWLASLENALHRISRVFSIVCQTIAPPWTCCWTVGSK